MTSRTIIGYSWIDAVIVVILTLGISAFVQNPAIIPYLPRYFLLYMMFSGIGFLAFMANKRAQYNAYTNNLFIYMISATAMLFVGMTGWFASPFFYLIYILALLYAFVFSTTMSVLFILLLSILFIPHVPLFPVFYGLTLLISLFMVIPLSLYLKKRYLSMTQLEKKILILEEQHERPITSVQTIMNNKISTFSFHLRQLVTDIKQVAKAKAGGRFAQSEEMRGEEIVELADRIFDEIDSFEKKTTGRTVVHKR